MVACLIIMLLRALYVALICMYHKVDSDDVVLSVPISNIVYERFNEPFNKYMIMEQRFNSSEIAVERKNENTEVED